MKKESNRQVIIGITGMLGSVVLGVLLFIMGYADQWYGLIVIAVAASLFIGFLVYIFGGIELFILGTGTGLGLLAFYILAHVLPHPYGGILAAIVVIAAVAGGYFKEYLQDLFYYFRRLKKDRAAEKIKREALKEKEPVKVQEKAKEKTEKPQKPTVMGKPAKINLSEKCFYRSSIRSKKLSLGKLRIIISLLTVLSSVISAAFLFLIINYTVFSLLCMIMPLIAFWLYIKYSDMVALGDIDNMHIGKIKIYIPLFFPAVALLIRCIIDFKLLEYRQFILLSALLFVFLSLLFFIRTKEYRQSKAAIFAFLIFALCYSPAVIMQVNYIFDYSQPHSYVSYINKKDASYGSKWVSYYLYVTMENGSEDYFRVAAEMYDSVNEGDKVAISESTGCLGIKYAQVYGIVSEVPASRENAGTAEVTADT